jgi:hypothetical protein
MKYTVRRYLGSFLLLVPFGVLLSCATVVPIPEPPPGTESFYVKAGGNDLNDGISEETPFRSLFKAVLMASRTSVKTITLLGTLDVASEQSANRERVFIIQGTGKEEITIRGKDPQDKAVLSGQGANRRVILIKGIAHIRFENVEISGGRSSSEGGGIGIGAGAVVTLGPGTVIRENQSNTVGGGVALAPGGTLIVAGASVSGNSARGVGGGIAAVGLGAALTLEDGEIRENRAEGGGGVAVYEGCSFVMLDGIIESNRAVIAGGGLVANRKASLRMEGGRVHENHSSSGGGLALIENCSFVMTGGEISGNQAGEHGGGLAADETSTVTLNGGTLKGNSAGSNGGGIFTAGPFSKTAGLIWGRGAAEADANRAGSGAAVYVLRAGGANLVRETTLAAADVINSSVFEDPEQWSEEQPESDDSPAEGDEVFEIPQ